jgi:hypothetical protein
MLSKFYSYSKNKLTFGVFTQREDGQGHKKHRIIVQLLHFLFVLAIFLSNRGFLVLSEWEFTAYRYDDPSKAAKKSYAR